MWDHLKKLSRDTLIYGLGGALTRFVGLLLLPVLTRCMTPAEYGTMDMLLTLSSALSMLVLMGMNASLTAFFFEAGTETQKREVVNSNLLFLLAWGLVAAAAAASLGPGFYRSILRIEAPYAWIMLSVLSGLLIVLKDSFASLFRLLFRAWSYLLVSVGGTVLTLLVVVYLVAFMRLGVLGFLVGSIVGGLAAVIFSFTALRSWFGGGVSLPSIKKMLVFGLPFVPTDVALWAIRYAERFLIIGALGSGALGVYSVGVRLGSVILLGTYAFRLAWAPFSLSIQDQPDADAFYRAVDRLIKTAASVAVVLLQAAAYPLLVLLTPPVYHAGHAVVGLVAYGTFFSSIYWVSGLGIILGKKTKFMGLSVALSAAVAVGLFALLIPLMGILGAALAGCLGNLCGNMLALYFGERCHPLGLSNRHTALLALITLSSLFCQIGIYEHVAGLAWRAGLMTLVCLASGAALILVGVDFKMLAAFKSRLVGLRRARTTAE